MFPATGRSSETPAKSAFRAGTAVADQISMDVADRTFMDEERRYDFPCRMGLLAVAVLHWIIFALLVWGPPVAPSTWEYSADDGWHLASAVLRLALDVF